VIRKALVSLLLHPWFRISRGLTLGVRGLVRDGEARVLLIRHSYAPGWQLPGGGVERGETVEVALARELVEEAGIELTARPRLFGIYSNAERFAGDHVLLFVVESFRQRHWQPTREILEARFFDPHDVPPDTTAGTRRRLGEVQGQAERSDLW
jgi:8-oxo-dGTP pyrophosphatase MutT (NUDIX family)